MSQSTVSQSSSSTSDSDKETDADAEVLALWKMYQENLREALQLISSMEAESSKQRRPRKRINRSRRKEEMGAGSSTEQISPEQKELESLAVSTGSLQLLHKSFSSISDPLTKTINYNSLKEIFRVKYRTLKCEGGICVPEGFDKILDQLGASIAEFLFLPEKDAVNWVGFLRGYVKCCGRMPASALLNTLFRVIALSAEKSGVSMKLKFDTDDADSKPSGAFSPKELGVILWVCWIMTWSSRGVKNNRDDAEFFLAELDHLILSAVESCSERIDEFDLSDCDLWNLKVDLDVGKIHVWVLRTVPNLADCFSQFVRSRIQKSGDGTSENGEGCSTSSAGDLSTLLANGPDLFTLGRTWAVSLSQRSAISEEILRLCFPCNAEDIDGNLLYRSSRDGKGINRFWSGVEGYSGPLLILLSGSSTDSDQTTNNNRKWVIGVLLHQGLESRDTFYGTGGTLFAVHPVFHAFSPSGKDKNFVYSHVQSKVRAYEANPKPVGIAFGGTIGNERIFIDEDFSRVTIRHHAVDKTYQPGPLVPKQGYGPVLGAVVDVCVWGLGGNTAKEAQLSLKKREDLFTQQRRKIDLKTFGNWEDSPEKMMMDMMSAPNAVRREER